MPGTLYYNGKIYTADDDRSFAEAFAVENGRFSFVGKEAAIEEYEVRVDLQGKCVIPGLIDSHCHLFAGITMTAMNFSNVDPSTKPGELGPLLKELLDSADLPEGKVFPVIGIDLTAGDFSASDIDKYINDRPVVVFSLDGHALLLNSRAMECVGIRKDTEDPSEDSYYVRDDKGNPTGLVIEIPAMRACYELMNNTPENIDEVILDIANEYAARGYTGVFEAMSFDDEDTGRLEALKSLDEKGLLPLRLSMSFGYNGEEFLSAEETLRIMKRNRAEFSSENLFNNTLKIIADGTVEERSALLAEPYADDGESFGSQLVSTEDMKKASELAAKEGFSVHIHAIGDRAVSRVIDVLSSLGSISGTKTIAHNQLYTGTDIERMIKEKDIFFQTTPQWMASDEHTLKCLGEERFGRQFPVGSMQRGGVTVTFGSDSCLEPETADAFTGMFYACARGDETLCGSEYLPPETESISRAESLKAYTINCAKQLMLDKETGSISEGKSADFVIVDRDIMNCPLEELKNTQVISTFFRGRKTFTAD